MLGMCQTAYRVCRQCVQHTRVHLGSAARCPHLQPQHGVQSRWISPQAPPLLCDERLVQSCVFRCLPPCWSFQRWRLPGRTGLRCWAVEECSLCSVLESMSTAHRRLPDPLGHPSSASASDCHFGWPENIPNIESQDCRCLASKGVPVANLRIHKCFARFGLAGGCVTRCKML